MQRKRRPNFPDYYVQATPEIVAVAAKPYIAAPAWNWWHIIKPPKPKPVKKDQLTTGEVWDIVTTATGKDATEDWEPADDIYYPVVEAPMQKRLVLSRISRLEYIPRKRDCDKFTGMGMYELPQHDDTLGMTAVFDTWVGFPQNGKMYWHSMMGFINENLEFKLRENQNDQIQVFPRDWEFWRLDG